MSDDNEAKHSTRIVDLLRSRKPPFEPDLSAFTEYWRSMCHDGGVPRRSDIDPRKIENLLSNAFILERVAPGLARLRIAGNHLNDLLGMEVRGMPISAFFDPTNRDDLNQHVVRLFDEPAIVRLSLSSKGSFGIKPQLGTMILMPLRSDLGDVSRAIGCFVTDTLRSKPPYRFRIDQAEMSPIDCEAEKTFEKPTRDVAFAETQQEFVPRLVSERPYLKLVTT